MDCGSAPVFVQCVIRNNRWTTGSVESGGGVFGTGTYVDCLIENNQAFGGAGVRGVCNPQFIGCTIRDNFTSSRTSDAHIAGGVYGPATLTDCVIEGNRARMAGGGAWEATLVNCVVVGNLVTGVPLTSTAGLGGGAGASVLIDCDVHDNQAAGASPIFYPGQGGGIHSSTATRCRIWGNVADVGAGASSSTLRECTVFGNLAANTGGGLAIVSGTSYTVETSILWGNSDPEIATGLPSLTVSYSDIEGGWPGTGNFDANPAFVAPMSGDFHLKPGSPCIDTGDPAATDADGSRIDVGAIPFVAGWCGAPGNYCVGKINSLGCAPAIGSSGTPSIAGPDDFHVSASLILNQKTGLMFWGRAAASPPFNPGAFCVQAPLVRTPAQGSGGSALPAQDCSGTYDFPFTQAYMLANGIGALDTIYAQYFARDPAHPDGTGRSFTDALEFTVCP